MCQVTNQRPDTNRQGKNNAGSGIYMEKMASFLKKASRLSSLWGLFPFFLFGGTGF
jgi:hypothetical protein